MRTIGQRRIRDSPNAPTYRELISQIVVSADGHQKFRSGKDSINACLRMLRQTAMSSIESYRSNDDNDQKLKNEYEFNSKVSLVLTLRQRGW